MKLKILIFIGFCISKTVECQTLDSILRPKNRNEQIEYKVKIWWINDSKIDTNFTYSYQSIYLTENDTLLGGYFYFDYTNKAEIYNGRDYIMIDKNKKITTIINLNEAPEWKIYNVSCTDSYLEILKILERAEKDTAFKWLEKQDGIRISATNMAYNGKIENETGTSTEFDIKLISGTYHPKSMTIRSYKGGKLTLNQGVELYELKTQSNQLNCYYRESLDSLTTIVEHRYIKNIKVGDVMPNWIVYSPNKDDKILLRNLNKENILLIEFWYTRCQYCIKSLPSLNELYKRYKDSGFKIIYANNSNGSETNKEILDFKDKYNIAFDVFKFGNIFEQGYSPTIILVDKNGVIRYKLEGYDENLISEVERLLVEMKK